MRDRTCAERSKAIVRAGLSYLELGVGGAGFCFQHLWKWNETSEEARGFHSRRDTVKCSAKGMSR